MYPLKALLHSTTGLESELDVVKIDMLEDPARVTLASAGGPTPPFRIGEPLQLEFPRAAGGGSECAPVQLVFEARDGVRQRYLLTIARSAATQLARHLNRRDALRVPPAITAPVIIQVRHPRLSEPLQVLGRELSTGGVGIAVPLALEERLVGAWEIDLALRLPHVTEVFELRAEVRYRRLAGDHVIYGLRFLVQKSELGLRFERELFAYVMLRQRELSR